MYVDFLKVCRDVTKTAKKIQKSDYLLCGKYKIFDQGKDYIGGYTNDAIGLAEDFPYIVFGDHTRLVKYVNEPCFIGADGVKLLKVINKDFIPEYIYFALKANPVENQGYSRHYKLLKEKKIVVKEYIEQQKIVEKLKKISMLFDYKHSELKFLDELVKSRFVEVFGTIDMSEEDDNWLPLGELSTIYSGTTPSTKDEDNWNGDIAWITPAEMNKNSFYINDTFRKITEKGRKSKSLEIMPTNTVLLSTRAPIGKVGITGIPMTCNQGFKNFECGSRLNPIFLYILLKENTEYLNSLGSGTTFLEISKSKISKTKVPVPPIELQNSFADFVKKVDKAKIVVKKQIEDLQELLDSKMDEYFG